MRQKNQKNKFSNLLPIFACCLIIFISAASANSVRIFSLTADDWSRPRAGEVIPQLESVKSAVAYWEKGSNAVIILSYPGEDTGVLWASELKDWLVTLGIPSSAIIFAPGLQSEDEIRLLVGARSELQ